MATFPAAPRDISVELFLNSAWRDVTAQARSDPGVDITTARPNESSEPRPSTCSLVLDNRSGNYSIRNPGGAYYGSIGRNTPIRVAINQCRDSFTRTVVNGWGTADTGQSWTVSGAGGTVQNSDFQVSSGAGTHSVPVTNAYRLTYLSTMAVRDADVTATVTSSAFTNVSGGPLEPLNILLRGQSLTNYYSCRMEIAADESVTLTLIHYDGTVFAGPISYVGYTQPFQVRAQVEGQTFRAKLWTASVPESLGWDITAHVERINDPGWVGIRSGVAAANTNTLPIVFSYDNILVRQVRFTGEVSAWPQQWDPSDSYTYAPIEAAGILRRLGQGTDPVQSTLYRGVTTLPIPAVAYWPCEDGATSTAVASALGGQPMVATGAITFAAYTGIPASMALPEIQAGTLSGAITPYTGTGQVQLQYICHFPTSGPSNARPISALIVSGTAQKWEIKYTAGGGLSIEVWTPTGQILDTGPISFNVDGLRLLIQMQLVQSGSNVNYRLETLEVGATQGLFITGTLNSRSINVAQRVIITEYKDLASLHIGHITVQKNTSNIFDLSDQLNAYSGETAIARLFRLCDLRGVPFGWSGNYAKSMPMGPQQPTGFIGLLTECADADGGTLYDARGDLGLMYRSRLSTYNQNNTLLLDYAARQVAPPLNPVDDDQLTRNDITVTRRDGGSARAELASGRMSVLPANQGGVGRYDTQVTLNIATDDLLDDLAGWQLHLGTVDATRYPQVHVNLASPPVSTDPDIPTETLDLGVDDRLVITNPKTLSTPDLIVQLARGYSEHISTFAHDITINAAPGLPYEVVRLDGDATYSGKLGSDGSTITSPPSPATTGTSMTVATPSGTLWTTNAGQMPIAITVAGEEMSVTAISGTSSPQTFTVTRSVNGVVKSQTSGTTVALKNDPILGL